MAFIVFSVSIAIVRSMFNRMMDRLPEEKTRDWKNSFKRKFKRSARQNQPDDKKESFLPNDEDAERMKKQQ